MGKICDKIGDAASFEMLAEECCELAHASLKMSRIIREENPTPIKWREAYLKLFEEYTDVCLCAEEVGIFQNEELKKRKYERFEERWEEHDKI